MVGLSSNRHKKQRGEAHSSVPIDENHVWHMETLAKVCHEDRDILLATEFKVVDVTDIDSQTVGSNGGRI